MPVTYSIDGDLVRLNLEGQYQPSDVIKQFEAALADPRCPEEFSFLIDASKSESLDKRSPADIRGVAEYLGPYRRRVRGRCAVVAVSDLHFGLSRMGSVYSEGVGVESQVFRTVPEAMEWLNRVDASPKNRHT